MIGKLKLTLSDCNLRTTAVRFPPSCHELRAIWRKSSLPLIGRSVPHKYNIVECSYNSEFHLHFLQIKLLSSENLGNGSDNDGNLNDLPALARGMQVTFLQFQIYSFHLSIESFARRSSRIFPLFILNMFSFIHAMILLGEVQEGGDGCRKSQRTKDVSFDYNSKVKFWISIFFRQFSRI